MDPETDQETTFNPPPVTPPINTPTSVDPNITNTAYIPPKPRPSFLPFLIILILAVSAAYYFGTQKTNSNSSTPTPNPDTARAKQDPALLENWETYTNPTYHFSLKYPSTYIVSSINQGITVSDPKSLDTPQITITVNQSALSAQAYAQSTNACKQNLCTEIKTGLLPDSIEYTSVQTVRFQSVDTLVKQGNQIFDISLNAKIASQPFSASEISLYHQILSTFQFVTTIQPTNVPITKTQIYENTYTDPVFETMIDVPQGWKVTTGKDKVDMYYFKITKSTAEKSPLSGSLVPEIYMGTDSYYTATGIVCSLEDCPTISSFDPRSAGQRYNYATKANIIKRSQNGKQDFYSLTFLYGDNLMNPPISANYITEDQKQEILKIVSTFRFQGTD